MNTLRKTLAVLCLTAAAVAAHADVLRVSMTSNFTLPSMVDGVGSLSVAFELPEPLVGVMPEGDFAFLLRNIGVDAVFNGSAVRSTVNTLGWFNYADFNYFGLDVRLRDLLVPGDLMQMILVTPQVLYSGSTVAPTLERLSLDGLAGAICYYGTGTGACTAEGWLSAGTYDVTAVPEPAVALMLPLGLALRALRRQNRQA
ncbi:MAG: hypothetical protein ACKVQR_07955 [Aquabacterium sp.]